MFSFMRTLSASTHAFVCLCEVVGSRAGGP
jgi:hypothetical protein